ncbi:uncharacterized protein DUF1801 [Nitrospirillum amazonense]|uniref:Uncharacterized protein DUF1801 n=1 Tax=Nitrospirillum amazonense TaxID=28077 RepID=A0A560ESN6_9PROT|nr:DUF1801 domain-containing protein [Nitrospirillum amazonense]TWB12391.1 uncharacterized protein DUF1801 [Nitrospirillum amazonense]
MMDSQHQDVAPPPAELLEYLAAYPPPVGALFLPARDFILRTAPQANELIYDSYNAVAIAFSFTTSMREGFCHLAAYSGHVNLGFHNGAALHDPQCRLVGSGTSVRHIRLGATSDLDDPYVLELVHQAIADGGITPAPGHRSVSIIKPRSPTRRRPGPGG